MLAAIFGCEGPGLGAEERAFFRDVRPWGFILFARNCETPAQVKRLVGELREAAGFQAPVLIDQEGGRVARLKPPHWPVYPPARHYGDIWMRDHSKAERAAYLGARLIAHDLLTLGINVDCLPLADVPVPDGHDIIGDRAYGIEPEIVSRLGRKVAQGLLDGGVLPVLKHIPGHGRARADSHVSLPVVETSWEMLSAQDFKPFKALNDLPLGMTAHVLYTAIDPKLPATLSPKVIEDVIRSEIGFEGLLMTDDLSMGALGGTLEGRARDSLNAGCDVVLHCNGKMAEMREVAAGARELSGLALLRAQEALAKLAPEPSFDEAQARAEWGALVREVA